MRDASTGSGVRLTELLAALSLGIDLGMGHPMEHVVRQSFVVLRLAERVGLPAAEREVVYYSSLLAWVGCHVDAYEQAKWFGDDQAVKHAVRSVDLGKPVESAAFVLRHLGGRRSLADRMRSGAGFLRDGRRDLDVMFENHWRAADALMERLGLSDAIRASVGQTFERWDGKGEPRPPMPAGEVAGLLRAEVRAGRLDGAAVEAVLRSAGHRGRHRRTWPAGLSTREVEVLRLVARGMSRQQIAERLVISRKTANNHVEHIYAKTGVSNRAMAAVFAIRHGLIDAEHTDG